MTQPQDKTNTNAIYLVIVNDPLSKEKVLYIKSRKDLLNHMGTHLDIKGEFISKEKAIELRKNKNDRDVTVQHNIIVPVHQWIRTENISFQSNAK